MAEGPQPPQFATAEEIREFTARYGRPYDPETDDYDRPAFVSDIKEGKNDPIYNAHSYHTKVPPRAIIPYILHYTQPGDLAAGALDVAVEMRRRVIEQLARMQPTEFTGARFDYRVNE